MKMKMNREQHPLDQFLKDKLSERSFSYQDSYWEAASQLIGHDRRRRRGWIFWVLGGLMILPIGILGWSTFFLASDSTALWAQSDWNSNWEFPDTCLMTSHLVSATYLTGASTDQNPASIQEIPVSRYPSANNGGEALEMPQRISSQELYNQLNQTAGTFEATAEPEIELLAMRVRKFQLLPFLFTPKAPKEAGDWKRFRHVLSARVGTQLAPAWRGGATTQPGLAPLLGVEYRYALTPTVRVRTGVLYRQRAGLNRDTTFTSVSFGFGREESSTTLENRSLHFVSLPVSAEFEVGARTGISLGAEASYLLGVRTDVLSVNELGTSASSETSWRYPQGYQRWDLAVQAGMHHYLGQGLRIGTSASYGLRDLTLNEYFSQGLTDRQINVRLWLSYDLATFGRKENRR